MDPCFCSERNCVYLRFDCIVFSSLSLVQMNICSSTRQLILRKVLQEFYSHTCTHVFTEWMLMRIYCIFIKFQHLYIIMPINSWCRNPGIFTHKHGLMVFFLNECVRSQPGAINRCRHHYSLKALRSTKSLLIKGRCFEAPLLNQDNLDSLFDALLNRIPSTKGGLTLIKRWYYSYIG